MWLVCERKKEILSTRWYKKSLVYNHLVRNVWFNAIAISVPQLVICVGISIFFAFSLIWDLKEGYASCNLHERKLILERLKQFQILFQLNLFLTEHKSKGFENLIIWYVLNLFRFQCTLETLMCVSEGVVVNMAHLKNGFRFLGRQNFSKTSYMWVQSIVRPKCEGAMRSMISGCGYMFWKPSFITYYMWISVW